MPKVSIVLPTYNGEKYIRESVESILCQTYNDWELIIVDDCSIDETPQIIENYALFDKRIRIIHNKINKKLPISLNIGFREAKGKYYTWTSDDNRYLPTAIEKMVSYLEGNKNIYLVRADMQLMNEKGTIIGNFLSYDEIGHFYNDRIGACFLYRSEVVDEIGEYDPNVFLVEDYDYWLRLMFRYGSIGCINENLYIYRMHKDNLTSTKAWDIKKQLTKLWEKNIDQLLNIFQSRPDYLCRIYYEYIESNGYAMLGKQKVLQAVPILNLDIEFVPTRKTIIYGAGMVGDEAYNKIGNLALAYVDKDESKIGTKKHGLDIISVKEMLIKKKSYQIVLAVKTETIYEVLNEFVKYGIDHCCVYQGMKG